MNNEELALIDSVENGEWQSVSNFAVMKKALMQAAVETAAKDTRINIRMAKRDVTASSQLH